MLEFLTLDRDNSDKFNTMMEEAEVLKRDIADYKISTSELEEKINLQKNELTRTSKLLKNVEYREFLLKQQLEGIQEVVEEEKKYLNNEIEDLQNKNKELEEQSEELTEEIENLKANQKRRLTMEGGGMNNLLKELNAFDESKDAKDEALETAESEGNNTQRRRSSMKKSKGQMFELLNKHYEDKNDPKKKEERAAHKLENDQGAKKIKELEKKLSGMTKVMATLQRSIKEEKKKIELNKKVIGIKEHEIDALREKLLQTTLGYSDIMNELNEQLESSYEVNRKLKRQLKNLGFTQRVGKFKKQVLVIIDKK